MVGNELIQAFYQILNKMNSSFQLIVFDNIEPDNIIKKTLNLLQVEEVRKLKEDKIIDKLFKYITLKSNLSYKVFKNIYGMSIEEYIKINLKNGQYWVQFENEEYEILNPNENRKKIKFEDGNIIETYDICSNGIGKLKQRLFEYDDKLEFLKKYCNFTGITIENKTIDSHFNEVHKNGIFYDVTFENCEFKDLMIAPNDRLENSDYKNCRFTNIQFAVGFLNDSCFTGCEFNGCQDFHTESNYLEGSEWHELVNKEVSTYLNQNTFNKCTFGFNLINSLIFRNNFNLTTFEMCHYSNSSFYYNEFNQCRIEYVSFKNSGEKNIFYDDYDDIIFSNKYINCNIKNVDFSEAILINDTFEDNKYNENTMFSLNYYETNKNKNTVFTEEELQCNNEKEKEIECLRKYNNFYHNLFKEYKGTVMTKKAYEFYYIHKCLELKLNFQLLKSYPSKKNFKECFNNFILFITCGFGEKPIRAILLSLCVIIICSFLYLFLGIDGKQQILYIGLPHNLNSIFPQGYSIRTVNMSEFISDFFICFYFSLISFATIGYGDFVPLTTGSRVLVCIQSVISILLIALFTGTMIRKSFRD